MEILLEVRGLSILHGATSVSTAPICPMYRATVGQANSISFPIHGSKTVTDKPIMEAAGGVIKKHLHKKHPH